MKTDNRNYIFVAGKLVSDFRSVRLAMSVAREQGGEIVLKAFATPAELEQIHECDAMRAIDESEARYCQ